MPQGTIKKLVQDRGFGFISGGDAEVFFHHTSVVDVAFDDLQIGQTVEFEVDQGDSRGKGPRASSVKPA